MWLMIITNTIIHRKMNTQIFWTWKDLVYIFKSNLLEFLPFLSARFNTNCQVLRIICIGYSAFIKLIIILSQFFISYNYWKTLKTHISMNFKIFQNMKIHCSLNSLYHLLKDIHIYKYISMNLIRKIFQSTNLFRRIVTKIIKLRIKY